MSELRVVKQDQDDGHGDEQAQHVQISDQQKEIRRLKAALRRAEEERDIRKKAAKYFAGESG